jgi:predicted DNA-binding protein (UPF0251 family)
MKYSYDEVMNALNTSNTSQEAAEKLHISMWTLFKLIREYNIDNPLKVRFGKKLTDVIKALSTSTTIAEASRKLNVVNFTTLRLMKHYHLDKSLLKKNEIDLNIIRNVIEKSKNKQEAAKLLGISAQKFYRILNSNKDFFNYKQNEEYTIDQINTILSEEITLKKAAKKIGISETTLWKMTKENKNIIYDHKANKKKYIENVIKESSSIKIVAEKLNVSEKRAIKLLKEYDIENPFKKISVEKIEFALNNSNTFQQTAISLNISTHVLYNLMLHYKINKKYYSKLFIAKRPNITYDVLKETLETSKNLAEVLRKLKTSRPKLELLLKHYNIINPFKRDIVRQRNYA